MRRDVIFLTAIVAIAAIFRMPRIAAESFWQDEVLTAKSAAAPFFTGLSIVRQSENAPPLYFLVLNRWAAIFGSSDVALRLPSALAGCAAVVVIYQLCCRLFTDLGRSAGLWAAAMLAVQPYHIGYSIEARPYAIAFLFALWSCQTLAILIERPSRTAQILYTLATAAMIWTHTFCGLVWVAQNLVVVPALSRGRGHGIGLRQWLILQGAVLVLLAPLIHMSMDTYRMGAQWIGPVSVVQTLLEHSANPVLLAVWIILSIVAIAWGCRSQSIGILLAVSLWLVPIVIPLTLSALDRPMFVPRYAIASLIGIHVLCGYGAARIGQWRPWAAVISGGSVVAAGLAVSVPLLIRGSTVLVERVDVRSAAASICQLARPGDAVWPSTVYYWPAFDRYSSRTDLQRLDALNQISDLPQTPGTVWMIVADDLPQPTLDGYSVVSESPLQGVKLLRADRTSPPKAE